MMSLAPMPMEREATAEAGGRDGEPPHTPALRGRTRTCVGCTARVEVEGPDGVDLIRLVLGPEGEIAVDPSGRGGFGRGVHVHARRACLERAARAGLHRATKGAARFVGPAADRPAGGEAREALSADALARAIQQAMDRRIEGFLGAAVRSRQLVWGSDAVTGTCRRGDMKLVVVACDAAAASELTEVRRAVAEGRAVAWGTKQRLGAIVAPPAVRGRLGAPITPLSPVQSATVGPPDVGAERGSKPGAPTEPSADPAGAHAAEPRGSEGVGVIAIASRTIAEALRAAVQAASAVASTEVTTKGAKPSDPRLGRERSPGLPASHRGRGAAGSGGTPRARGRRDG